MSADIIQYEVRCITYKAFWPRVKLEFNQSFIDNQQGPHDFSIKGQRANILGLVGHMVSVMATNCLCSAKAAVNYTERDRNAVFHETFLKKQVVGWIWSAGLRLSTPGIKEKVR